MTRYIYDEWALYKTHRKTSASGLTIADTDAWLTEHGNGMNRLPKDNRQTPSKIWRLYGKVGVRQMIHMFFLRNDLLVPADIPERSCAQSITRACNELVKQGYLERVSVKRKSTGAVITSHSNKVNAYKRA